MAYAPPDPKRVKAEQERKLRAELREHQIREEIRACYREGPQILNGRRVEGYSPKQIKHAGAMILCNTVATELSNSEQKTREGEICWERLGISRGGRKRGNLYRLVVS